MENNKKLKKFILILGIVLIATAVFAIILGLISSFLSRGSKRPESLPADVFYDADYSKDIFEDNAYMSLNRSIMYMEYDSGEELTEKNYLDVGIASEFFYEYFNAIIRGDYNAYSNMLTENYMRDFEPPEQFTMQMLYDIEVNRVQSSWLEEYQGQKVAVYCFAVKYKIFQNNGTFRNDIASNQSTTQYYQLYSYNGEIYLNSYTNKLTVSEQ